MPSPASSNEFIATLFTALQTTAVPAPPHPASSSTHRPLAAALEAVGLKHVLITLHCLFPHAFLAALDLLDRRLVVRVGPAPPPAGQLDTTRGPGRVYYVRSSQRSRRQRGGAGGSDGHDGDDGAYYEVRLTAWSCTCAAFAFAALGREAGGGGAGEGGAAGWGGLRGGAAPAPACKHVLACFLLETWPVVEGWCTVLERERDEETGWAAGWK
jgi:hypothetical protein